MSDPRPQTLGATVASCDGDFDHFLKYALPEFIDVCNETDNAMIPARLADEPCVTAKPAFDAWVAAVAEYLSRKSGSPAPMWTEREEGFRLSKPWFPWKSEFSKKLFLVESPVEFRRRMIFTEAEPLRRA